MLSQSDDTLAVDMPCEKPSESRHSVHEILWICCFFSLFFCLTYIIVGMKQMIVQWLWGILLFVICHLCFVDKHNHILHAECRQSVSHRDL